VPPCPFVETSPSSQGLRLPFVKIVAGRLLAVQRHKNPFC
jgi:hypothetical protein